MGFNAEGFIKPSKNDARIRELELRLVEYENQRHKKKKAKFKFNNILSPVAEKDLPWM